MALMAHNSPFFAEIFEDLKNVLFSDSAVAGEAAGLAMGLIMLGTANGKAIEEMIQYAHETQHEKIIRGLAIGLSLIMYGREEEADSLINQLVGDKVCSGSSIVCSYHLFIGSKRTFYALGPYSPIRRHVHHWLGLQWHGKQ